ncbi:MAG: hypothetical protein ABSB55_05405 [Acidimicrobiales bacterium]|jgi:hypothetical protein
MSSIPAWQRETRRGSAVRRRLAGVTVVGVAMAVAATSGVTAASASTTTTTPGSGKSGSSTAAMKAYETCLAKHGVKLPTGRFGSGGTRPSFPAGSGGTRPSFPGGTGAGFPNSKFAKAEKACASLRPKGTFGLGGSGGGGFSDSAAFAAYSSCLKLHGVTLPASYRPSGTVGSSSSTTTLAQSPKMKAALAACAPLLPKQSPSTGTKKPANKSSGQSTKKTTKKSTK